MHFYRIAVQPSVHDISREMGHVLYLVRCEGGTSGLLHVTYAEILVKTAIATKTDNAVLHTRRYRGKWLLG